MVFIIKRCAAFIALLILVGCTNSPPDYNDMLLDGVASLNMNKPEKAVEDFTKAIDLDPDKSGGYLGRANALNTLGRWEKAVKDYNTAITIDPGTANAYVNRAIAYSYLGRIKEAVADYEKGLELDPEIDDPPGFMKRMFDDVPNKEKGIRRHLEVLKEHLKKIATETQPQPIIK